MKRVLGIATLALFGSLVIGATAYATTPAVGGQFCSHAHDPKFAQDKDGGWHECKLIDGHYRWTPNTVPSPSASPSVSASAGASASASPSHSASPSPSTPSLPVTGSTFNTPLAVGIGATLMVGGGTLFFLARRRRTEFRSE